VVLDESGSVINQTDYEPFGATVAVTGIDTRKKFIDKELDRESTTYNTGVRQYDPEGPGFASVDPLWEKYPAWTPYHYSFNNPLGTKDPSGLDTTVGDAILDGLGDAVDGIIHVLTAVTRYEVLDGKSQYSLIDGLKSTWNTATGENGTYAQVRLLVGLGAETTFWATATGGLGAIGGVGKGATQVGRAARMVGKAAKTASKATNTAEDFFAGTKYTGKVLGQMKKGDFHAFPKSVEGFQGAGKVTTITGGDGVRRSMLKIPGDYRGRTGVFEFIKEADGTINHRLFRPLP